MNKIISFDKLVHNLKGSIRDQRFILDEFTEQISKKNCVHESLVREMELAIKTSVDTWNILQSQVKLTQENQYE